MHYLITGHTGFKGAWLTMLLIERGHEVSGIALEPVAGSLYASAGISEFLENDIRCDIRDMLMLKKAVDRIKPDVVVHMAAQALVRESYISPLTTFETNVMGTINLLRAVQENAFLKAQLIVTTDKVYKNVMKSSGYVETDPLGGQDPYSASKAMADIATQSWLSSFNSAPTAIARAGNVIGGGDVCSDRLIPDLVDSYISGTTPKLRAPNAIRPWQHVLDCLNGYLLLVENTIRTQENGVWNFGPDESKSKTVSEVANLAGTIWGVEKHWELDRESHLQESEILLLNSNKARNDLGWNDKLDFESSVDWTINWYKKVNNGLDPLAAMLIDIHGFESKQSS
jgi:CDP-glucose 4,6-dehydratase